MGVMAGGVGVGLDVEGREEFSCGVELFSLGSLRGSVCTIGWSSVPGKMGCRDGCCLVFFCCFFYSGICWVRFIISFSLAECALSTCCAKMFCCFQGWFIITTVKFKVLIVLKGFQPIPR